MDNRNFLLAIVLSVLVLFAWQFFVAGPQLERTRQQADLQTAAQQSAQPPVAATAEGGAAAPAPAADAGSTPTAPGALTMAATRDAALAQSPRIAVDTKSLTGSINLRGGRLDDIRLKDFRETVDPNSPTIILLSPENGPNGYFAEFGWLADGATAVPGPDTLWSAPTGVRLTADTPVTLTWDNGAGLIFQRTIAVDPQYMFTVTDQVTNSGGAAVSLYPYGRVRRIGEPTTAGYYILHEGPIGVFGDHGLSEPAYKDIKKETQQTMPKVDRGWLGFTDKYWAAALIPPSGETFEGHFIYSADAAAPAYQAHFRADPVTVAAGATSKVENHLFAGAKQVAVVNGYRDQLGIERFDLLIDWGWFYFITKPMFFLVDNLYRLIGNFGLAILAVTVLVKLAFFPLANKSYKSMSRMKAMQPAMTELRERYKDDRAKQQQELMALYKREKINPVAGCWPVLLQIPVFFSLYKVLFVTIEMRHAPFFGWIQDLSAPDPTSVFNLFGLIPWTPPHLLMIGIWPLIMGVTMFVQMRLNPMPAEPAQQVIFTWMPVIFTFMLSGFPAGLVIYWAWNNTLSVSQQYFIMRRQGVEVDLWGNILSSFRKKPKADPKAEVKAVVKPTGKPGTKPSAKANAKS